MKVLAWVIGLALIVLSGMMATICIVIAKDSTNRSCKGVGYSIAAMNAVLIASILINLLT
jgi:hypothetical protein